MPGALAEHAAFLRRFASEQGIQTNEVRRSWILAPSFLLLAQEAGAGTLDLVELGASAGFNLLWDRYGLRYQRGAWTPEAPLLALEGDERRPVPAEILAERPVVRGRVGIDVNPLDMRRDEDLLLLKSFVWADQADRLEQLERAAEAVRREPPELVRGDYVELLPRLLGRRRSGALTVVFQTASTSYLSPEGRERVYAALAEAAGEEPLGWISTTAPLDGGMTAWGLDVRLLPGERRVVAHADFHGTWLDWFPAP